MNVDDKVNDIMNIKARSAGASWLLTVLSVGLYAPFWLRRIGNDARGVGCLSPHALLRFMKVLSILWVGYYIFLILFNIALFSGCSDAIIESSYSVLRVLGVMILALFLYAQIKLGRVVQMAGGMSGTVVVVITFFGFFSSLCILQHHLNSIISNQGSSAGGRNYTIQQ